MSLPEKKFVHVEVEEEVREEAKKIGKARGKGLKYFVTELILKGIEAVRQEEGGNG